MKLNLNSSVFFADNRYMHICSFIVSLIFLFTSCVASAETTKPIYKLPLSESKSISAEDSISGGFILGSKSGLYKVSASNIAIPLWTDGAVYKIIQTNENALEGKNSNRWYFMTSAGILTSTDLINFEYRNNGLPFLKMKEVNESSISFSNKIAQLKDLEIHPRNNKILVTATKDRVYITYDGGLQWSSIGSMSLSTSGIKAVAVCTIDEKITVFMSQPIFGFSYTVLGESKNVWKDVNGGFEKVKTQTYPDEISDIMPVVFTNAEGNLVTEIFVSQTFMPNIYRFNWNTKRAELLYKGKEPLDTIDGLFWTGSEILYTRPGEIASFNPTTLSLGNIPKDYYNLKKSFGALAPKDTLYSAWFPYENNFYKGVSLAELWLLKPETCSNFYSETALHKKSIYCPAHHVSTQAGIEKYKKIIIDNKLDSLVIDMKDDYGLLRYDTKDPVVLEKGYISRYHIDLDHFVSEFKKNNIYLIARIVVFKDKNLSNYKNGKYAVWDRTTNKPWIGTKGMEDVTNPETGEVIGQKMAYYDENWVDPYSPEVWDYNVRIAKELISRGFDEIQFDYIRFPTDGRNMSNAQFRWKDSGMDKESALLSFLAYARKHIDAPIGIDIYGANGWYRSGTRTGQDVEQLSEYVDVICPMFYPSHFEQNFLEYSPASERPYRIYFYGTYRNTVIGRNRIIIRPWVQAFYLNVRYDRQWYNKDYVQKQIYGVRDSVNSGYMYWNNIGRYDDILPDIGTTQYTGPATEASLEFRKPALSSGGLLYPDTINDTTDQQNVDSVSKSDKQKNSFPSISDIRKLWQAYNINDAS